LHIQALVGTSDSQMDQIIAAMMSLMRDEQA
jgi:hypothetical protein